MTASLTVGDDFGAGGRGLAPRGAHGEPSLRDLLRHPALKGVAAVDFSGVASNAETIAFAMADGTVETFTKLAAVAVAFDFTGGTANAQAIDLARSINADSLFLIAVVVTDTVFVFGAKAGSSAASLVAGNATITNGLANTTAPATLEGASDAVRKEVASLTHVPNASEVAAGEIHIPLPFVAGTHKVTVYVTATGAEKNAGGTDHATYDGTVTVGTVPDRLIIGQGTILLWAATDTLHIEVTS